MRNIIIVIFIAFLTACTLHFLTLLAPTKVRVLTDNATGCEYLAYQFGVTPRLNPNGTQVCALRKQADTEPTINPPIYGAKF